MEDNAIQLLELVHSAVTASEEHQAYLEKFVNDPKCPPAMRVQFAHMQGNLKLLATMVRDFSEMNMSIVEKIQEVNQSLEDKE